MKNIVLYFKAFYLKNKNCYLTYLKNSQNILKILIRLENTNIIYLMKISSIHGYLFLN